MLSGIDWLVCIQVPESYTFRNWHVGIQDKMGRLDYRLDEFRVLGAEEHRVISSAFDRRRLGGPPGASAWAAPLSRFFERRGWDEPRMSYAYDFGDDW